MLGMHGAQGRRPHRNLEESEDCLASLLHKVEQLELQRHELAHRDDVLQDLCSAYTEAVVILGTTPWLLPCRGLSLEAQLEKTAAAKRAAREVDARIQQLLTASGLSGLLRERPPLFGTESQMLVSALRDEALATGTAHASLLDGSVLSMLHCGLVCIRGDFSLVKAAQVLKDRNDVMAPLLAGQADAMTLLTRYDAAEPASASGLALLRQMAAIILHCTNHLVAAALLRPEVIYGNKIGQAGLPPEALLDAATQVVGLAPEQLRQMLRGLWLFQKLQAPLAKAKVDISKRMLELMPVTSQPETSALSLTQSSSTKSSSSRGSREGLYALTDQMAQLGLSHHDRLMSLTNELNRICACTTWLDHCSFLYAMGQMSWLQQARLVVSLHPYAPLMGLWIRRLVTCTSLAVPTRQGRAGSSGSRTFTSSTRSSNPAVDAACKATAGSKAAGAAAKPPRSRSKRPAAAAPGAAVAPARQSAGPAYAGGPPVAGTMAAGPSAQARQHSDQRCHSGRICTRDQQSSKPVQQQQQQEEGERFSVARGRQGSEEPDRRGDQHQQHRQGLVGSAALPAAGMAAAAAAGPAARSNTSRAAEATNVAVELQAVGVSTPWQVPAANLAPPPPPMEVEGVPVDIMAWPPLALPPGLLSPTTGDMMEHLIDSLLCGLNN